MGLEEEIKEIMDARFDTQVSTTLFVLIKDQQDVIRELILTDVNDSLYDEVINEVGIDNITKNTEDFIEQVEIEKEELKQAQLAKELFAVKEQVFNIEEVKNSTNEEMKEKIRSAASVAEVYFYVNKI